MHNDTTEERITRYARNKAYTTAMAVPRTLTPDVTCVSDSL